MSDKTCFIAGTFDLFHVGHVRLFQRAARIGRVIVAVNPDEFAERYKRRPLMPLEDRQEIVKSCRYVDRVVTNWGCEDSKPVIELIAPDFIVHGDDWTGESLMRQMGLTRDFLDEQGIEMLYLPYTKGVSSSEIIRRIESSGRVT